MEFSLGCELTYHVDAPTPFVFNIQAQEFAGQVIRSERLEISPDTRTEQWTMPESGNRYLRVLAQPGDLAVRYEATVALSPAVEAPESIRTIAAGELPLWVLPHLNPSRYCQSDRLQRMAERSFGQLDGYAKVNGICNWIRENVDYVRGSSDELTSAFDTATQRAGVCRDFAHLGIAFCRAQGVPARYVSAYAWRLFPPDFHAVFEAFLEGPQGQGWYLFDPTRMSAPDGLVRIGIGRDAGEVAFASPFGPFEAGKPKVWIEPQFEASAAVTTRAIRPQLSWLTGTGATEAA